MRHRLLHLLRSVIWVCVLAATSCVVPMPAEALQVVMGPPAAVDKSSGAGQYTLSGTVVDALTGAPVRRALVRLVGPQSQLVLTDEGGKFRFENLSRGQNGIDAQKPGYTDSSAKSVTVITIGTDTSPLVLKLEPESTITVKVTGEDGDGVEGLPVRVLISQVQEGRRYLRMNGGGQTDEKGEFRAGNLTPGKYYVSVGPSLRPTGHAGDGAHESDVGYPRVFYPNAAELEGAVQVDVNSGRRARVEFVLSTVPLYRISGASQLSGPVIMEVDGLRPGLSSVEIITGKPGKALGSDEVKKSVRVDPAGGQTIDVGGIAPSGVVSGTVKLEGNASVPPGVLVFLREESSGRAFRQDVDSAGNFRFFADELEPGVYEVSSAAPGGLELRSVSASGTKVTGRKIEISNGSDLRLTLTLARGVSAGVKGIVERGGKAAPGMMVVLVPEDLRDLAEYRRDQSDSDGSFSMNLVSPGKYTVVALKDWDLEWGKPEVIQGYLAGGTSVEVGGGEEREIKVTAK